MQNKLLILLFTIPELVLGQIRGVIKDSISNAPIPYVNIWFEGKNIGTTSDLQGNFELKESFDEGSILFSAIGYKSKHVKTSENFSNIFLEAQPTILREVVITNNNVEHTIGQFQKSKINSYFACGSRPWIAARFFPFKKEFSNTPYLKSIRLLTDSDISDAKFNIRLYTVDKNGQPKDYLYKKNILVVAKRGKKKTPVELSEFDIVFPENGFFIAIEWLIIDENRFEFNTRNLETNKRSLRVNYEPSLGTIPAESDENSWYFIKGVWRNWPQNQGELQPKRYRYKYNLLAIELTLTN